MFVQALKCEFLACNSELILIVVEFHVRRHLVCCWLLFAAVARTKLCYQLLLSGLIKTQSTFDITFDKHLMGAKVIATLTEIKDNFGTLVLITFGNCFGMLLKNVKSVLTFIKIKYGSCQFLITQSKVWVKGNFCELSSQDIAKYKSNCCLSNSTESSNWGQGPLCSNSFTHTRTLCRTRHCTVYIKG